MDKEVDPAVLAVINEKRLRGDKRTPVEIIARMGVFDARQNAAESAWLATGDNIIATIWAEFVSIGAGGRWFCLESLDTQHRIGGGERTAAQILRAKNRLDLLQRAKDADQGVRAVLQTNRIAIRDVETDKAAKVSMRVPDEEEWHIAAWDADDKVAVLVRGARGWQPTPEELQAARSRGSVPDQNVTDPSRNASREALQASAKDHLVRHFSGYGYKAEDVSSQALGWDIVVSDKKGATLLKLAVKGVAAGAPGVELTPEERKAAQQGDPWRLAVVTDPIGTAAQHKLYKPGEIDQAPGVETPR